MSPAPPYDYEDDGLDYEVEPVDEYVLQQEALRAREQVEEAKAAVDVDALYRDLNARDELDFDWEKFRPRFSIKNLLVVTAVLAVLLTSWKIGMFNGHAFAALISLALLALGSAYAWVELREQRRRELIQERNARLIARARGDDAPDDEPLDMKSLEEEAAELLKARPRFRIRDLMLATAGMSVLLWMVTRIGVGASATLMGFFALGGLVAEALGADPPPSVRLAWWLSIVGYCLVTLGSAVASALGFG